MSQHIRDRIQRKLATLGDDRLYQILDFVEFLELKYPPAAPTPTAAANPLQKFADGVEDRLRTTGLAASTVAEAMGFLNKAVGVLGRAATAAQSAAQQVGDAVAAAAQAGPGGPTPPGAPPGSAPPGSPPGSAPPGATGTGPATGPSAPPAAPGGPAAPPATDRPQ